MIVQGAGGRGLVRGASRVLAGLGVTWRREASCRNPKTDDTDGEWWVARGDHLKPVDLIFTPVAPLLQHSLTYDAVVAIKSPNMVMKEAGRV